MSIDNQHRFYLWLLLLAAIYSSCCSLDLQTAATAIDPAGVDSRHTRALTQSSAVVANACPTGCINSPSSKCPNRGCMVKNLNSNATLCCTNASAQRFAYELAGAGVCDSIATNAMIVYTQRAMEGVNTAFWRSGSIMNVVKISAQCLKATTTFAVPTSFKSKARYHLRMTVFYRGTRHVRDYLNYNNRMSGPCNGMFKGICGGVWGLKNKQFCLYDRYGGLYSCDWLIARDKRSSTSCNLNTSPSPDPNTDPSPPPPPPGGTSPGPPDSSSSPNPGPSPPGPPSGSSPNPKPATQYCVEGDENCVHPDQAVLMAGKADLTAKSLDVLTDWRSGGNMCRDFWEGIDCYDSGPYTGAVQMITLDYGLLPGKLPSIWYNLSAPLSINLEGNQLTGTIPSSWMALSQTTTIRLAGNGLSGTFPATTWGSGLRALQYMSVRNNQALSGCIPSSLKSREFYMYDTNDSPRSVGAGGDTNLVSGQGPLMGTGVNGWC